MTWSVWGPEASHMNIVPDDDLMEHPLVENTDECPCGPRVEPVETDDGSIAWIVTHHSLDGREANE